MKLGDLKREIAELPDDMEVVIGFDRRVSDPRRKGDFHVVERAIAVLIDHDTVVLGAG